MIEKLKDFWIIFKNSKHEFYEEKIEALKLLERVKYVKDLTSKTFKKNKEILSYLNAYMYDYPKSMHNCIKNLVSLFQHARYSKTLTDNSFDLMYILENIDIDCHVAYNYMYESFKKKDFAKVKEKYVKLIKNLRDYEERYDMTILDDFYDYDKI